MKTFSFHNHGIPARIKLTKTIQENLASILKAENVIVKHISIIYCTDDYLLSLNQNYLKHNTLTDILTFTLSELTAPIESEIYISIERVRENAKELQVEYQKELLRVMIHGILHLCGYNDKTPPQRSNMREREDLYLNHLGFT